MKRTILPEKFSENDVKGTHTIYFTSSFYVIYQKSMITRTDFHCITTQVAHSSG